RVYDERGTAMKSVCCKPCNSHDAVTEHSWTRGIGRTLSWIVPSVVLAAMPKCPLCLVAYVALFTGLGISLAAARFFWWFVGISCVAALVFLLVTTSVSALRLHFTRGRYSNEDA